MKRSHFINSILTLTGTAFVYGCKNVLEETTFEDVSDSYSSPTIDEAKVWFSDKYISKFENLRTQQVSVSRKLNWDKSQKIKSDKHDFVWVPIEYEADQIGTAILMWNEGEEYIQKLAQYLSWSVNEGFLMYRKPNGENDGFLAQVAFDPARNIPGEQINPDNFTGLVINADWNENILRTWRFLEGKMVSYFNPESKTVKNKGGRIEECISYTSQYVTVTGSSCGNSCTAVNYTIHTSTQTVCNGSGSDYNYSGSGGYNNSQQCGCGPATPAPVPQRPPAITDYQKLATNSSSWERIEFNKRTTDIVSAVGLGGSSLDISLSKATTIANALSLSNSGIVVKLPPIVTIMGRTLAGIGVVTSGYSLAMAIGKTEDFNWTGQDGLNLIATVASGVALVGNPVGWWVIGLSVASSGISIGIAIYDAHN